MAEYTDESYPMNYVEHQISDETFAGAAYHAGHVTTPNGTVEVRSWAEPEEAFTTLHMVHDGWMHSRRFGRYHRPRYLVTLAKRFAADITEQGATQ